LVTYPELIKADLLHLLENVFTLTQALTHPNSNSKPNTNPNSRAQPEGTKGAEAPP